MWHHKLLEEQAYELGLQLTPLAVTNACDVSQKIECCGGVVVRLITESSADTTICLRDDSGTCFCALHGDITSTYPEAVTSGALLIFRDITLLVSCANTPPLLIACLPNLVGLMLPEEQTNSATTMPPAEHTSSQTYSETNHGREPLTNNREERFLPCAPEGLIADNNKSVNNTRHENALKMQSNIHYQKEVQNTLDNDCNKDDYCNKSRNNDSSNIKNTNDVSDYDEDNNRYLTSNVTLQSNAGNDAEIWVNTTSNPKSVNCYGGKESNNKISNVDNKYDDECLEFADEFEREQC